MVSQKAVVYERKRFQRLALNWVWRMIFGTPGTDFFSTLSEYAILYVAEDFSVSHRIGLLG